MSSIKYFIQFLIISSLFIIYKILGLKIASDFSSTLLKNFGPFFRSKKLIQQNILKAFPEINSKDLIQLSKNLYILADVKKEVKITYELNCYVIHSSFAKFAVWTFS